MVFGLKVGNFVKNKMRVFIKFWNLWIKNRLILQGQLFKLCLENIVLI